MTKPFVQSGYERLPNDKYQTIDKLEERHRAMLAYQRKIAPFTPSIRELQELWGLNTTSAVFAALHHMEKFGMVVSRSVGKSEKSKKYFAVSRVE